MADRRTPDASQKAGLEEILAGARAAAHEAAALALAGFRQAVVVEHKGAVDLVTRFDRESETLLKRRLGEAFTFPIIGEEMGPHVVVGTEPRGAGGAGDVVFYVDPIDGTTNFVHGHPFWCVSIGLVARGQPILGVVVAPALGAEWIGWVAESGERRAVRRTVDLAAVLAGARTAEAVETPCAVSGIATIEEAMLATGFPYDRRTNPDNNFDAFVAIKRRCQAIRRCGSAALDLCLVSDGTYDGYWEMKLSPWDIAGGVAILRGAGGRVTDFDGDADFISSGRLIATNGRVHDALASALARVWAGAS
jgi:myo-inositol-1(or 4)-monophosphatase